MNIALFIPCFMDRLFPEAGVAAVRVLERLGHAVDFRPEAVCCGQPAFNAGSWNPARAAARRAIAALAGAETVVCPSASCTAMIRNRYTALFAGEPDAAAAAALGAKTFEFSEFLVRKLGVTDVGARFAARVAWHGGCHGRRELGLVEEPRKLLAAVKWLDVVEPAGADICCGFGGTFSVKHPEISSAMGLAKASAVEATGATWLASADSSCLMQIGGIFARRKSPVRIIHLAQILAST
ncbi:MAG: (Fe-S)-binding protein [Planctomycetota bacterium]